MSASFSSNKAGFQKSTPAPNNPMNDIGKENAELFDDHFFFSKRLIVKTKSPSGLEILSEGHLLPNNTLNGSISGVYKSDTFSVEKFRIQSDGRAFVDSSLRINPVFKLCVSAEDSRQEPGKPLHSFGIIGLEYRSPARGVVAHTDLDVVNGPTLRGAFNAMIGKFKIGSEASLNTHLEDKSSSSPKITNFAVGVSYHEAGGCVASLKTTDFLSTLSCAFYHPLSTKLELGTQVDYGIKQNSQKLNLGARYKLADGSIVKTKANSCGLVCGSVQHRLSPQVLLTVCTELNLADWTSDSHKFGMGLTYE